MTTVKHRTSAGVNLEFHVLAKEGSWNDVAGIYAFGNPAPNGSYYVHYVGQALSFKDRICSHERWDEARRLGASHVLAMAVPTQADRDKIESILIAELRPKLNVIGK